MKKSISIAWSAGVLAFASPAAPGQQAASPASATTYAARCAESLEFLRQTPINPVWQTMSNGGVASNTFKYYIGPVAARLSLPPAERQEAVELYLKGLRLADNTEYAPWSTTYSLATTLLNRETLPPEAMEAQKEFLERWNYDCSAGTINMRLYLYTAGYLASELWPDFADSATPIRGHSGIDFRGKTVRSHDAAEIKEFCRGKIYEIFHQFTVQNQVEHDLVYFPCDVDSVDMLANFSQDPEMKRRATMVMDYFMLMLAANWNHGYDAETYYREKFFNNLIGDTVAASEELGWLYFGTPRLAPLPGRGGRLWFCDTNGYRMPPVFEAIARDRDGTREKRESQFDVEGGRPTPTVWKTAYHTPDYTLSSAVDEYVSSQGIKTALFKEEKLTNLTWVSGRPASRFFVFQENIAQPYAGKTEKNAFGAGENPYSQRFQDKRTLIGIYDVPESYPYYRQYTVYRQNAGTLGQIEEDGWVFTHTGPMLFGFYSMMPTTWEKNRHQKEVAEGIDVRWCDSRKNAWVLETAEATRYPGDPAAQLAAFAKDVLQNGMLDTSKMNQDTPEFSYRSIYGDRLRIVFADLGKSVLGHHFINDTPVDYRSWKTLDSPWARQDFNSPIVKVDFAGVQLTYDFNNWTVDGDRERAIPGLTP